jgi:hypothetical protein
MTRSGCCAYRKGSRRPTRLGGDRTSAVPTGVKSLGQLDWPFSGDKK